MYKMTPRLFFTALCFICLAVQLHSENWPRFRGPTGQGETSETDLPMRWSPDSNIAWKIAIPGLSWSSPIVFGDRIFLTTAMQNDISCRVLCVDRKDGNILWNNEVFQQVPRKKERLNSYATPTPVTDGEKVYALFGDGSIAALNYDGTVAWTNREAEFYSQHGLGASPIIYENLLIMTFDGSSRTGNKRVGWQLPWDKSYVIALDKHTGKVKWKTMRGMSRISHVTPAILREPGRSDLILSPAGDVIQAFDPKDGKIAWTVESSGEGVVPSAVIGDGLIFTISGFMKHQIRTVRTGGEGNITKTHVAWEDNRAISKVPSMVYKEPYLFSVSDNGIAICRDAESGKIIWQERIGGDHYASPIVSGNKIYFLSLEGETVIIDAGPEFNILARNSIEERCQASIAVSRGQLFIRSDKSLFCIGDPTPQKRSDL